MKEKETNCTICNHLYPEEQLLQIWAKDKEAKACIRCFRNKATQSSNKYNDLLDKVIKFSDLLYDNRKNCPEVKWAYGMYCNIFKEEIEG